VRYQKKSAVAYMFRNFGHLVYVTLPVSVAMAFFFNFSAEMNLYAKFVLGKLTIDTFWDELMSSISVARFAGHWWQSALTLLLLIVTFCMLAVKIGRHMRVGEMPVLPFKNAFRLFPTMALYVLVCFACVQFGMLLPVGVLYLLKSIQNVYAMTALCFVFVTVTRIVLAYLFALLIVAFPIKYGENYRFNVALAYSVRITSKYRRFTIGFAVGYPLVRFAAGVIAAALAPFKLDIIVYALFFFTAVTLIPCVAFKLYHDSIGSERRDLNRLIFD